MSIPCQYLSSGVRIGIESSPARILQSLDFRAPFVNSALRLLVGGITFSFFFFSCSVVSLMYDCLLEINVDLFLLLGCFVYVKNTLWGNKLISQCYWLQHTAGGCFVLFCFVLFLWKFPGVLEPPSLFGIPMGGKHGTLIGRLLMNQRILVS